MNETQAWSHNPEKLQAIPSLFETKAGDDGRAESMRVLVQLSEAYGGWGGIQQFNCDMLQALCSHPGVSEVVAAPRLRQPGTEELPAKLTYSAEGANSKLNYIETIWKVIRKGHAFELVVVAHLNLLPFVQLLKSRQETATLLVLFGLEAWSPRSWFYRRCLNRVGASASISEFTRDRFCAWSGFQAERVFLLIDGSREAVRNESWGVVVDPANPEEVKAGILEALRRPTGVRPSGLEFYSEANFERRAHQIVTTMLETREHHG